MHQHYSVNCGGYGMTLPFILYVTSLQMYWLQLYSSHIWKYSEAFCCSKSCNLLCLVLIIFFHQRDMCKSCHLSYWQLHSEADRMSVFFIYNTFCDVPGTHLLHRENALCSPFAGAICWACKWLLHIWQFMPQVFWYGLSFYNLFAKMQWQHYGISLTWFFYLTATEDNWDGSRWWKGELLHIWPKFMACFYSLLARDSMLSALYAIANPSVRLSVCHMGGSVENGWS